MAGGSVGGLAGLAEVVIGRLLLIELGLELLGRGLAQGLFDELAGLPALIAGESPGLDPGLALGINGDLDRLVQEAPPTWMVNFTEPSGRACSTTPWPRFLASIRAFSIV